MPFQGAASELDATLIPLLIGVVGKRDLSGHDTAVEEAVYDKLSKIRRRHRSSPIWVLTSAAPGADWCAVRATARLAAEREPHQPAIRLVCPLPLSSRSLNPGSVPLLEEDFDSAHLARFADLMQRRAVQTPEREFTFAEDDLITFELAPLDGADPSKMHRDGGPSGKSQPHRTLHYEQAAVFIADCSQLLIAVMPEDEAPDRIGGPARTLHYRCTGQLPTAPTSPTFGELIGSFRAAGEAATVAAVPTEDLDQWRLRRASRELPSLDEPTEWLSPRLGFACQIVPGPAPASLFFKGEIRPRESEQDPPSGPERAEAGESEVLAPLRAHDNYNDSVLRQRNRIRFGEIGKFSATISGKLGGAHPGEEAALVRLYSIRRGIADMQAAAKEAVDRAIVWLGWLFVASVAAFTLFKIWPGAWLGGGYILLVLAAATVHAVVRARHRAEVHEDYRAAAEALRVQVGWRLAGISDRAERHYVPGSAKELARVRGGVAAVNTVVALEHRAAEVAKRMPQIKLARENWAAEQVRFFSTRVSRRRRSNAAYLLLVVLAFGGGLGIFARTVAHYLPSLQQPASRILTVGLVLSLIPFVLRFRALLLREPPKSRLWLLVWLDALGNGISRLARWARLSRLLYPLLWCFLPVAAGWWFAEGVLAAAAAWGFPVDPVKDCLGALVAMLNGIAGMAVYRREKLAIEPEERNYVEMADVFATADRLLESCKGEIGKEQAILRELGRAALAENASWLRAHRERPIEQIAGG